MFSLKIGAPLIGGAVKIIYNSGEKPQPLQKRQHADILKLSASRRVAVGTWREQPQGSRSQSSSCSRFSPRDGWKQTQLPVLDTGLKRSVYAAKRCKRVTGLKDNDVVQCVCSVSNLTSSISHHVLPDSSSESSLYRRFVDYAVQECSQHMILESFPMKNEFRKMVARDGKSITCSYAFQSEKIRNFRTAEVNGGSSVQVLNLVAFPSATYDLPFFCADLVTLAKNHLIVLDLNPLYNSLDLPSQYKEKYINPLCPLWKKYKEVLPWGGEMSSEALEFFSPYVIWSRPVKDPYVDDIVFEAFKEYLHVWLNLVDKAEASKNVDEIHKNQESQHRYMMWRSTKDPGRNLLTRLYGETQCEVLGFGLDDGLKSPEGSPVQSVEMNSPKIIFDRQLLGNGTDRAASAYGHEYMKGFLFADMDNLGRKSFLDYFPEFKDPKGSSILKKRSVSGKGYSTRPWDENGNYIVGASA